MKRILSIAALTLAAGCLPTPAMAATFENSTILPILYSTRYCQAKSLGMDQESRVAYAWQGGHLPVVDYTYVNLRGNRTRSDLLEAVLEIRRRCGL